MPKEQISTRSIVLFYIILAFLLAAGIFAAVRNSHRLRSYSYQQKYQALKAPFPAEQAEKKIAEELKIDLKNMTPDQKGRLKARLDEEQELYRRKNAEELEKLRRKRFLFLWKYSGQE